MCEKGLWRIFLAKVQERLLFFQTRSQFSLSWSHDISECYALRLRWCSLATPAPICDGSRRQCARRSGKTGRLRYQSLMKPLWEQPTWNNVGVDRENGDVENQSRSKTGS